MATATGVHSYGICDYCGQRYRYLDLRKNWRGFMVCPEDYEPKQPQIETLRFVGDAIALADARPDRSEPYNVFVGIAGIFGYNSIGSASDTTNMQPLPVQPPVVGLGQVGTVTVVIT